MQAFKIKKAEIRAFRGIPTLAMAVDGKSLLLKGGNGTGKSSIIEALEFFFTGRVAHLEGAQGVSFRRHGPHAHFKLKDLEVSLTFDPGNISLKRTIKTTPTPPSQLIRFFDASARGTFILRRSQILEFINSDPGHRFFAIGNIMGLSKLDSTELEMMKLRDEIEGEISSNKEHLAGLFRELTLLLGQPTQTIEQALENLNKIAVEYGYSSAESLKELDKYAQQVFKKVKKKVEERDTARKLSDLIALTGMPAVSAEDTERLQEFAGSTTALITKGASAQLFMLEFLEHGKSVLQLGTETICPFCNQQIDRENLLLSVEERIRTVSQLTTEASSARRDSVGMTKSLEILGKKLVSVIEGANEFEELREQVSELKTQSEYLTKFAEKLSDARDLKSTLDINEFLEHAARVNECFTASAKQSQLLLEKVGLTEEEETIVKYVQLLGSVRTKVAEIEKLAGEVGAQNENYRIAALLYDKFSSTKKQTVQATYNALQSDIQRYFGRLHPNEVTRSIRLEVFPRKRASTKLLVDSLGKSAQDPRALESEGHLDSLGICIFLAFVNKFNEGFPLVMLDDVVTTIDAGHRQKLAEILVEEFKDKQLIITTHDEVWFEQFQGMERAYKSEGNFKNLEIVSWDPDSGPRIRGYRPLWESVGEKIKAGDKFSAGNETRRYLEWILENLAEDMEVPLIFKESRRYMIGDLLPPIRKRVLELLAGSGQDTKFETAFKELEKTLVLANLLSHNNVFASDISLEEVNFFFLAVRKLHEAFSCTDCGNFVSYYRDLRIIRCSSPRCEKPLEIRVQR